MSEPNSNSDRVITYTFSEEEAREIESYVQYIDEHGPYDPYDSSFFVGHSRENRLVEFDALTSTIDDIMEQCEIPEEHREELTSLHRSCTRDFLRYYKGPIKGPIPLLGEKSSTRFS